MSTIARVFNRADLERLANQIELVIERRCNGRPAFIITFRLPGNDTICISNVSRQNGISLLRDTAPRIIEHAQQTGGGLPGSPSTIGDLSGLADQVEEILQHRLGTKPGLGLVFCLPPDYDEAHWVVNIPHAEAALMMNEMALKMIARNN